MRIRSLRLAFALCVFVVLVLLHSAVTTTRVAAQPEWPLLWVPIDWDPNENGAADDWRDVEIAYYQQDADYLYLKLRCYAMPGSAWPSAEGRYKWFIDLDANMYHSGENIFDAEYLLFVEDTDDDGQGEMYLVFDINADGNLAEYEPWPPTNYADFEVSNPSVGGWRIVGPNLIEMYVSWSSIGDPPSYSLTWATDQENPNLDQGPTTDHVDEEEPITVHDVAAVNQTPNTTNVMQGSPVIVEVLIENQGMEAESFEVTCYFNMSVIETSNITDLAASHSATLFFYWDTTEVPPGTYAIKAWADSKSAIAEVDEVDNWCTAPATVTIQKVLMQYYLTVVSPYGVKSGDGWYDNGTNAYAALNTGVIDCGNGTRRVFTQWGGDASGTSYTGSDPIYMDQNKTATAMWETQFYLEVDSPYGTSGGEGWYDAGSMAYATLDTGLVDCGNGTRRVFTQWGGDASGTDYVQSDPILMDGPKTATAMWKTQFYLEISSGPGGATIPSASDWYDEGAVVQIMAIPDTDYLFDHWDLDSIDVGSDNPYNVTMDTAHSLHAVFQYSPPSPNYYLDVETDPSGVAVISGEGWYNESENVLLTAPDFVDVATGIRYEFAHWDINGASQGVGINPITVHMDANYTATAHYTLQYYLTVISPYDSPTPSSGWFDEGEAVTPTVISPWPGLAGTRYVCTGWTGTGSVPGTGSGSSTSFVMNEPSSIVWNWKTQHHLTVRTNPPGVASISGEGWYDEYVSVPLAAPDVENYRFIDWTVDGSSAGAGAKSISVTMSDPRTAVANYERISIGGTTTSLRAPTLRFWIGLNGLLIGATLATGLWVKRKQRKRTGATFVKEF